MDLMQQGTRGGERGEGGAEGGLEEGGGCSTPGHRIIYSLFVRDQDKKLASGRATDPTLVADHPGSADLLSLADLGWSVCKRFPSGGFFSRATARQPVMPGAYQTSRSPLRGRGEERNKTQ